MASPILKHCGRPMVHVGRGLVECAECGTTETTPKEN